MSYLRAALSIASVATAYFWSRLILPLRKEQMPFSGWGDGVAGSAATLAGPVILFWLATLVGFLFIAFKPYFRGENTLTRAGRWIANFALGAVALSLLFYATHGPPVRFFAVYGVIGLGSLWVYVDVKSRRAENMRQD